MVSNRVVSRTTKQSLLGLRLLVLLSMAFSLMYFTYHKNTLALKVQQTLTTLVSPVQYAVGFPVMLAESIRKTFQSQSSLLAENERLRDQVLVLQAKSQRLTALEDDNKQLLSLLGATEKMDDRFVTADLLAVKTSRRQGELVLAKGTLSDVYKGQPVLDAQGLMGQVVSVTPASSHVLLITDQQSAVPVQVSRNGLQAIVTGMAPSGLQVMNLPTTTDIVKGDDLVTSGLGGRFPAGYPVGRVMDIQRPDGQAFMTIKVMPAAKMHGNRHVLLVWPGDAHV